MISRSRTRPAAVRPCRFGNSPKNPAAMAIGQTGVWTAIITATPAAVASEPPIKMRRETPRLWLACDGRHWPVPAHCWRLRNCATKARLGGTRPHDTALRFRHSFNAAASVVVASPERSRATQAIASRVNRSRSGNCSAGSVKTRWLQMAGAAAVEKSSGGAIP